LTDKHTEVIVSKCYKLFAKHLDPF